MPTYCSGILIAELRKRKGFSQEQLAKGICDRRTISYIETGSISPSKFVYEKLMQKLGVDPHRFSSYIASKAEMRFDEVKSQISQLFKEEKNDEIEVLLQALENDKSLKNNKFVNQFVLKTRAWILAGGMDWDNAEDTALYKMLNKAVRMTCDSFDLQNIKGELYTLIEIDLIRMIGLRLLYTGKKEEALRVLESLDEIISIGYIAIHDVVSTYAPLLVSLSKAYRWLEKYNEALAASEKGIRICTASHVYASLPWLLYQKASALYHLGDKAQSLTILDEAAIIAKNFQEVEFTQFLEERKNEWRN